ncbi:spermine synthase-like [Babylonia areolata]|uniref:spermine synthase-like n=1 Tax=Babylonia areolata TaxID=304850 RepID=UPI003FD52524
MGTCTILLAFQLRDGVKREDVAPVVPDLLSEVMKDANVVYPGNGIKAMDDVVVAIGNEGKCIGTLRYHSNRLLTIDVQHECKNEKELEPMNEPYTLDYIRTMDRNIEIRLGMMCEKSVSVYAPIRRPCRLPRNYAILADERLAETDYSHAVCEVMSPFQKVSVMQSRQFGRVLTLDDDVMFGECDEVYITTVLGLDRGNTYGGATVLILGGGDGGLLYRLVSLPQPPKHVLMAEIDDEVMKACRKHMRSVCGHVFDSYKTDSYQIEVRDCVEVLKESVDKGVKYDYVINDLTEFSVEKGKYGFSYDFKTNNVVMELSFKCLKKGGKYLARGNCLSAEPYLKKIEKEFQDIGAPFQRFDRHVLSFREIYCFFEAQNVTA